MTLLYLVVAWICGIWMAAGHSPVSWVWLLIALMGFVIAYAVRQHRAQRLTMICVALFACGGLRQVWAERPLSDTNIARYADSGWVTLIGMNASDADIRDTHANLHVEVESIVINGEMRRAEGTVLVQAPRYQSYAYGDMLRVQGNLLTPPEFDDFSWRDYLARQGIHTIISDAKVEIVSQGHGHAWWRAMYAAKDSLHQSINDMLPSPEAPLLSGVLLGIENEISPDIDESFNLTGTAHVIAISGANIIVIARVLLGLLLPLLGRRNAMILTMIGLLGYSALVGGDPAVARAAIMGVLALGASLASRRAYGLTTLAAAVWGMTLHDPNVLWDIGFQLSVTATAGVVVFTRPLETALEDGLGRLFSNEVAKRLTTWLSEPLVVGLVAQIATLPLILHYFGRFSAVSLPANLLIAPAQPYIMTVGWLAVLVHYLIPPFGQILGYVVWIPLAYTLAIVRNLAQVDWAVQTIELSTRYTWIAYSALIVIGAFVIQHPEDRHDILAWVRHRLAPLTVAAGAFVLGILIWATIAAQPDGQLHISFLDVGHGHAVLIETPAGAKILIDGGANPTQLRRAVGDALPFWDRTLDVLIVTQEKSTRTGALPDLLERYSVGQIVVGSGLAEQQHDSSLMQTFAERGLQVVSASSGREIRVDDGVSLRVFEPLATSLGAEPSRDGAILVQIRYKDATFLVTPDLADEALGAIQTSGWPLQSSVLDISAFGSEKANPDWLLEAVHPQVAVISIGAGNRTRLPAPEVLTYLGEMTDVIPYRTDYDGTVEIVTDGHQLQIYSDRD